MRQVRHRHRARPAPCSGSSAVKWDTRGSASWADGVLGRSRTQRVCGVCLRACAACPWPGVEVQPVLPSAQHPHAPGVLLGAPQPLLPSAPGTQ